MEQQAKLTRLRWIAGGCVVLALLCAVVVLRKDQTPAAGPASVQTTMQLQQAGQTLPAESDVQTEQTQPSSQEEPSQETSAREESQQTQAVVQQTQDSGEKLFFPYALDDGKLMIQSLFQYSGVNPDSEDQMGDNVAGLLVTNASEQHLTSAGITLLLSEGRQAVFLIQDLPPAASVMVFDASNQAVEDTQGWHSIQAETVFEEQSPLLDDKVAVSVDGTRVTLTNLTQQDLLDLRIYCHCLLNTEYFGGRTYCYQLDVLPGGGSAQIDAWECCLDRAEVVRIEQNAGA